VWSVHPCAYNLLCRISKRLNTEREKKKKKKKKAIPERSPSAYRHQPLKHNTPHSPYYVRFEENRERSRFNTVKRNENTRADRNDRLCSVITPILFSNVLLLFSFVAFTCTRVSPIRAWCNKHQ
jgi:hypothetical protein